MATPQGCLDTQELAETGRTAPPPHPQRIQRDGNAAHSLTVGFWLQDCERTFSLFKPTSFVAL